MKSCRKDDQKHSNIAIVRRYGTKCSGCNEGISPTDLVRRAKDMVFHVECFRCSMCLKEISTGDELYHIGGNKFVCKEDYNIQLNDTEELSDQSSKKEDLDCDEVALKDDEDTTGMLDDDGENGLNGKRRGPRTTIKAKQLEILKSAFSATPKPTRHMREKLAQETGLSMRVIQVWFQNRRSKERRLNNSVLNGGQGRVAKSRRTTRKSSDGQDLLEGMVNALLDPSQCSFQNQDVQEYYNAGNRALYPSCEAGSYEPHPRLEDIVSTTAMMQANDNTNVYNRSGLMQAENRNCISQQSLHHIIQENTYNTASSYPSYINTQSNNLHMNPVSSLW